MARTPTVTSDLLVWHWNANGYHNKKAVLQQHVQCAVRAPDIILIQETHSENTPTLPGYRAHASPPSARDCGKGAGRGVCTFVRKGITFTTHDIVGRSTIEHCTTEVIIGRKSKESILLVNIYSNPAHRQQKFRALLHKALRLAPEDTILLCGDFNAPHEDWGYLKTTVKGRALIDDATDAGFHLLTDPTTPTRIGTSVTRDTTPDLTFVRTSKEQRGVRWRNTGQNLGSDHYIIEVLLPISKPTATEPQRRHRLTNWDLFRRTLAQSASAITDIDEWTDNIVRTVTNTTTEIDTDETVTQVDNRLAHMFEARQSIQQRWKTRRTNRRLRKKVAELNRAIECYSRELCAQQWHAVCNEADGQMHKGRTWNLLRHLLDETKTKGFQRHNLAQTLHAAIRTLGEHETGRRINARYLPSTPKEQHDDYKGADNLLLDRDIEEWEVRAVLQTLNCKSAAGPDRITNKALRNLNDGAITALTQYFNVCWRAGRLPKQWKTAKTVLIPKPGKPPSLENLRPISLTSCVGKVLEHVLLNRWQRYLETEELYPNTILGFRERLSTQDAMILLQHEILDVTIPTRDNRAVLGLDLQSAFDKVRHSAILAQVSRLNMGRRSFAYIHDFLSERTATIHAGDLELPQKSLGSTGTPQGSVISPLLFNLVMIGVANRLAEIPQVRHTIYADDITLWVPGGCDGHIETTLQHAVDTIEQHLEGSGLVCSPQKSELLVIPPPGTPRHRITSAAITVRTRDGTVIPRVQSLRVLGMILESNRCNGTTVNRLTTKLTTATRLIRRVTTRHHGMKEASLLRLIQSFAISHVAYVAAYHHWKTPERAKIDAAIRKTYKAALGLLDSTSTARLLELGIHNTLDEIAEAHRTAQLERLSTTRTGRSILDRLGYASRAVSTSSTRPLPDAVTRRLRVNPIPKNMHPEYNHDRRVARAKALTELYARDTGALYVDVAEYPDRPGTYVAVAVRATTGDIYSACSLRVPVAHHAEETAIALALTDPQCTTVLSDSRSAILSYARNSVCESAVQVRSNTTTPSVSATSLRWFPAHMDSLGSSNGHANRNETADAAARELTNRAASPLASRSARQPAINHEPLTTYTEVLQWYRLSRRTMSPPHPRLTRAEAVLYRQLQTNSVITPVLAQYVCPGAYDSVQCSVCARANATLAHLLWDCERNPDEAAAPTRLPDSFTSAMISSEYATQLQAVQQLEAALARQRLGEAARPRDPPPHCPSAEPVDACGAHHEDVQAASR